MKKDARPIFQYSEKTSYIIVYKINTFSFEYKYIFCCVILQTLKVMSVKN